MTPIRSASSIAATAPPTPPHPKPLHYFPNDDPSRPAPNLWRQTANIYTNWVKAVYDTTPYDINDIPKAAR